MRIRIGTRGSALALAQSRATARRLRELGHEVELEVLKTEGDADRTRPFAELGEAGLFVRAIQEALLDERVDLAVHSYKDLPSRSPQELVVGAVPAREDPRDRLLVAPRSFEPGAPALPLKEGAVVGTASARREALLRDLRPDLRTELLRGNVPTRVQRLRDGVYDAILLASAGLHRLAAAAERGECAAPGLAGLEHLDLDPDVFVPAPSQGALALELRADDAERRAVLAALDDPAVRHSVAAERELLRRVDAGCGVPFGAHARALPAGGLVLVSALEVDGTLRRARHEGHDPVALARAAHAVLCPEEVSR